MKPAIKLAPTNNQASEHDINTCTCETEQAPCCNKETQVFSRVVGYIRPIDHWNEAKKEEFEHRKTYKIPTK